MSLKTDGGGVGVRGGVRHRGRDLIRRAVGSGVAEPGLALQEGAVVGDAGAQAVEAREQGGEEALCARCFGCLGHLGRVAEDVAFVGVVVDDEGEFVEVACFEGLGGGLADEVAVDDGAELVGAVAGAWAGVGGVLVLLVEGGQGGGWEGTEAV